MDQQPLVAIGQRQNRGSARRPGVPAGGRADRRCRARSGNSGGRWAGAAIEARAACRQPGASRVSACSSSSHSPRAAATPAAELRPAPARRRDHPRPGARRERRRAVLLPPSTTTTSAPAPATASRQRRQRGGGVQGRDDDGRGMHVCSRVPYLFLTAPPASWQSSACERRGNGTMHALSDPAERLPGTDALAGPAQGPRRHARIPPVRFESQRGRPFDDGWSTLTRRSPTCRRCRPR